jgi:hypothetical protein
MGSDQQAWLVSVTLRHCRRGHGATQWWPGASPWASPRRSCRTPAGARRARLHARINFPWPDQLSWPHSSADSHHAPPWIGGRRRDGHGAGHKTEEGMCYWKTRTRRASPVAHGGASAASSPELCRPASPLRAVREAGR